MFGTLAKDVYQCNDTARLPEYIARAFPPCDVRASGASGAGAA